VFYLAQPISWDVDTDQIIKRHFFHRSRGFLSMARDLTTDTKNALIANEVHPILMFHAAFDEGDIYYWTGYGDLTWDGQTWTGMGDFAGVSSLSETENIQANGAVFSLNGVPSAAISMALNYEFRDRPCTLYLGVLNITTGALIADPYPIFGGRMDTMSIEDGADTGTISVTAESQLIDLYRPRSFATVTKTSRTTTRET
jgi:hypothetical protein